MNHSIIIYYSWSGSTEYIAKQIARLCGADLLQLFPTEAYPVNYSKCVDQARIETRTGFCPPLESFEIDLSQYDTVFIGSPIWCGTYASPIRTFLRSYDLSGKTVYPFCTHGGGGEKNFSAHIKEACSSSNLKPTLVLFGSGGNTLSAKLKEWIS